MFFLGISMFAAAQDTTAVVKDEGSGDMMDMMDEGPKEKEYVRGTFKATHTINLHTTETLGKYSLDFRILHRFDDFTTGAYNFWGLDGPANIQLRFDYSINNRLTAGVGRTSFGKLFDGYLKYKLIRQEVKGGMPITVTLLGSINLTTLKSGSVPDKYEVYADRLGYCSQVLIARKFNSRLSLQVSPTYIHINLVETADDMNDIFAVGLSGRFKFSKRMAVTLEYIPTLNEYSADKSLYHNSLSVGIDIETGGHVFQLFLTNSSGINEVQYIPYTTGDWAKGEIRLGFNVSRVFSVGGKRDKSW